MFFNAVCIKYTVSFSLKYTRKGISKNIVISIRPDVHSFLISQVKMIKNKDAMEKKEK